MTSTTHFDTIIIGGSYAGLSAAMSLGRALRSVLIIDAGEPCNRQTPHSHNFLTQDGKTPLEITTIAKKQVEAYNTVTFHKGFAISGKKMENGFEITTQEQATFTARKLIFATGIKDIMPDIEGFSPCWGISIIHCPYCHGYEVRHEKTGIFGNGDYGFEFSKMISNWTKDLTLFTNGESTLTVEQTNLLQKYNINIVTTKIDQFEHENGYLTNVIFQNGKKHPLKAMYAHLPFELSSTIPVHLGCELTEEGRIKVDAFQQTTVQGVFACGDNSTPMRSLAAVVAFGQIAGVMANRTMIEEEFTETLQ